MSKPKLEDFGGRIDDSNRLVFDDIDKEIDYHYKSIAYYHKFVVGSTITGTVSALTGLGVSAGAMVSRVTSDTGSWNNNLLGLGCLSVAVTSMATYFQKGYVNKVINHLAGMARAFDRKASADLTNRL